VSSLPDGIGLTRVDPTRLAKLRSLVRLLERARGAAAILATDSSELSYHERASSIALLNASQTPSSSMSRDQTTPRRACQFFDRLHTFHERTSCAANARLSRYFYNDIYR
jgi:hypothetical protein